MSDLRQIIFENRSGNQSTIPSVCSTHPDVLLASLSLAKTLNQPVVIEATSNQVNQFGGYTGMTPVDFYKRIQLLIQYSDCPPSLVHLGGDHLGPQAWKTEDATSAMKKAAHLIECYVRAGFTKIHLDCSEGCAGDATHLSDEVIAQRSAELAVVALESSPDPSKLLFIVGTEVPPPGGHRPTDNAGITPTTPEAAEHTLAAHQAAFDAVDARLWPLVGGLVVQPGLEFSPSHIDHFDVAATDHLSRALTNYPDISFEAHSTDYQKDGVFKELGKRGFTFQKVGPALTFAYRRALYQLSALDSWENGSQEIGNTIEGIMQAEPGYWDRHYVGSEKELRRLRHFSFADRVRYYWPHPKVNGEMETLQVRLAQLRPSEMLMRQFLDSSWIEEQGSIEDNDVGWHKRYLIRAIQSTLRPYFIYPQVKFEH